MVPTARSLDQGGEQALDRIDRLDRRGRVVDRARHRAQGKVVQQSEAQQRVLGEVAVDADLEALADNAGVDRGVRIPEFQDDRVLPDQVAGQDAEPNGRVSLSGRLDEQRQVDLPEVSLCVRPTDPGE
jgi:hypothetical protein